MNDLSADSEMVDVSLLINGNEVELPYPLDGYRDLGDGLLILLRVPPDADYTRNIHRYDSEGNHVWKVDVTDAEGPMEAIGGSGENLGALDSAGNSYDLDVETGELEQKEPWS